MLLQDPKKNQWDGKIIAAVGQVSNTNGRGSPPVKVRREGFTGFTKIPRPGR